MQPEAINTTYQEQPQLTQPHLRLVASNGALLEQSVTPEVERLPSPSDIFKGRVAIEGLEARYDAITELAELTDGQMRTELPLTSDDKDLYGPDGRSLTETARKGLKAAQEQAEKNPNLWFEVDRRELELEEILDTVEAFKTGLVNTVVLTTEFPEQLLNATEDVGGYNIRRKQALRRAITRNPDTGKILLISQTLDGSNTEALTAVDTAFGFQTDPSKSRLGQRQHLNLTAQEQAQIMDKTVSAYDQSMSRQFGGEWYAGRRPADYRNTYDFVRKQHDLMDTYVQLRLSNQLTDTVMYDMAATINERFKQSKNLLHNVEQLRPVPQSGYDRDALQREMRMYGQEARSKGVSFSACGSTWKAEGLGSSTEDLLEAAGIGGNLAERSWHGGKIFKNTKCVSCDKVRAEVGACKICKDCVDHPKGGKVATTKGRTGDPKTAKINTESAKVINLDEARKSKAKAKEH
jgi:hypothetical protein